MPNFLTVESMLMCPHGGTVQAISTNTRTQTGGAFAVTVADTFLVAGCPFVLGLVPHPCVQVQWVVGAARSTVTGNAPLTESSVGLCIAPDGAVQGTVLVTQTQPQAAGL